METIKNKISVINVNKRYNGQIVLEDISFDIKEGEFVSILGSSGCGKTTLLKILIGIEKCDSGVVLKDDEEITNNIPSKRGMGLVFQNYALFPNMNVWHNVAYALKAQKVQVPKLDEEGHQVYGVDKELLKSINTEIKKTDKEIKKFEKAESKKNKLLSKKDDSKVDDRKKASFQSQIERLNKDYPQADFDTLKEKKADLDNQKKTCLDTVVPQFSYIHHSSQEIKDRVEEVLAIVGLTDFALKKPGKMSGGQQQRVALARTLALNPDIILFDEPMAALDADIRMSLRKELKELQKKLHKTMIYVTHDQEEAFSMSDRIIVMNDNHIAQFDTPNNIYKHPADAFVKKFVVNHLDEKAKAILDSTK